MTLKDLIGFQLLAFTNENIIVRKGAKTYSINIDEDYGDCCGFNEISTKLLINENDLAKNPIITNVEYDKEDNENGEESTARITFYGSDKTLATLDSRSSSGSGWCYGACVSVSCKALGLDEIITQW